MWRESPLRPFFGRHSRPVIRVALYLGLVLIVLGSVLGPFSQLTIYALDAPTPLTPIEGTIATVENHPPLGIPEFTWTDIPGATSYRLQFSQDVAFVNRIEVTTPNTSYTPINASQFPDGVWYWRVRVDAPSPPSSYSSHMSFEKQWATPDNRPTLISPPDYAESPISGTLSFFDHPAFSWQPVMGAAQYRLQIASSFDGFASPIYSQITLSNSHQPTAKLANGDYFWRVVPIDPAGRSGTPSEVRELWVSYSSPPELLAPDDGSYPTFTPTFRWKAVRGAQFYRLQYSTDPTFNTSVITVDTRNTSYTPTSTFPNDVNYYWRVRAHSGTSITDWSPVWDFVKKWYLQPELLTPTNLYQHVKYPFFSWTPVPGASHYKIEWNTVNSFPSPSACSATTANTFWVPRSYATCTPSDIWYWRVTPIDGGDNSGKPSSVFSFRWNMTSAAPHLVYPLFYYQPNAYQDEKGNSILTLPHEDRTAPAPVFTWQRALLPTEPTTGFEVVAYRLQVDDDPLFSSVNWQVDTENLSAAPTSDKPFTQAGVDYYWRVRPLTGLGGSETGVWSQIWKARFDASLALSPTSGSSPVLLRPSQNSDPAHGSDSDRQRGWESVETTPLLEWRPLEGASAYEVQISADSAFGAPYIVSSAVVPYPIYTPFTALGNGTYYWRVRGLSGGSPVGVWSATWRFQIASQSHWRSVRTLGELHSGGPLGVVEEYDPTSNSWIMRADMPTPRYGLGTAAASNGKIYAIGGWGGLGPLATVEEYDPATDTWATRSPMPTPRYNLAVVAASNGKIYAIGGWGSSGALATVEEYDPTTNTWATKSSMPTPRYDLAAAEGGNGRIYVTGGRGTSYALNTLQEYDPTTNTWATRTNMPTQRYGLGAATSNGRVHAIGGYHNGFQNKVERYDPSTNAWSTRAVLPNARSGLGVAAQGDSIYAVGGWDGSRHLALVHQYDATANTWTSRASMHVGRSQLGVATIDNKVYAIGGWSDHLLLGSDPPGDMSEANYDLTTFYAAQSKDYWFFGLNANPVGADMIYGLYVDLDHVDGSGASSDALGFTISTVTSHRPEYAIYIKQIGGAFSTADVAVYRWAGSGWATPQTLESVGGALSYSAANQYVEIQVPNTAIGMEERTSSAAISLFSAMLVSGQPQGGAQDTVPSDPNVSLTTPSSAGATTLSRFASISERVTLATPPNCPVTGDPTTFPSILPFVWHPPVDVPWHGYGVQVATDSQFTTPVRNATTVLTTPLLAPSAYAFERDATGDNTYYWRARPCYNDTCTVRGAWSQGMRFKRVGFVPENLSISVSFATPSFSWDLVEGAKAYDLQVDNDPGFGSPEVSITTALNSYTPTSTLAEGTYYWRVRVRRSGTGSSDIINDWSSPSRTFTLGLPLVSGLTHYPSGVVWRAPTLCWTPVVASGPDDQPVFAAWKYRVQISKDNPGFSPIYGTVDTEQACWSPTAGYHDGTYYWRVAVIDGNGKPGSYGATAQFTKQYLTTALVDPPSGGSVAGIPTFVWTAVDGAASYKLEVSRSPTFSPLLDSITTNNTRYTPTKGYAANTVYYWRVAMVDKDGRVGPFTGATVIVTPPTTPDSDRRIYLPLIRK